MSSGDFSRAMRARRTVLAVATLAMALAVGRAATKREARRAVKAAAAGRS